MNQQFLNASKHLDSEVLTIAEAGIGSGDGQGHLGLGELRPTDVTVIHQEVIIIFCCCFLSESYLVVDYFSPFLLFLFWQKLISFHDCQKAA